MPVSLVAQILGPSSSNSGSAPSQSEPILSPYGSGAAAGGVPPSVPASIINAPNPPYTPGKCGAGIDTNQTPSYTFISGELDDQTSLFDQLIELGFTCKRLMITAIGPTEAAQAFPIAISLRALGIPNTASGEYVVQGNEAWIPLNDPSNVEAVDIQGMIIEFRNPISRFYLQIINQEGGQTFTITFMSADDICKIEWKPELNPA